MIRVIALMLGALLMHSRYASDIASAQPIPRWDPGSQMCSGVPSDSEVPGSWQVSAPRVPERRGADVEVGLRNKFGVDALTEIYAIVISPRGEFGEAEPLVMGGDEWVYANYPSGFIGGSTASAGPYTIVWQSEAGFIACDGFMLQP